MPASADADLESVADENEDPFPSLALVEPGLMALRVSRRVTFWVVSTLGQTARFQVGDRRGRDRLLVTDVLDPVQREFLEALFEDVVSGPTSAFLAPHQMRATLTAPTFADLAVGVLVSEARQVVLVVRGNLERVVVPWRWFRPSGTGTVPDFAKVSIEDGGLTIRLGDYEAAMDAILYEFDRSFRARERQRELATDTSLGGSVKRLRIQKGVRRNAFPGISSKEVARIERGDVAQPHASTLRTLADTLGVDVADLGTY